MNNYTSMNKHSCTSHDQGLRDISQIHRRSFLLCVTIASQIIVNTTLQSGGIWKGKCTTMKVDVTPIRKNITSQLRTQPYAAN